MATKKALALVAGDVVQIDGVTVTVERLESNVAIIFTGPRFPGGPVAENSYGCGGDELIEIVEPE